MKLNERELKKYLEYVIFLEKERYIQMQLCNKYRYEIKRLGVMKKITAPIKSQEESALGTGILFFLIGAIGIGIPFSIILCGIIINAFMGGDADFGHVAIISIAIGLILGGTVFFSVVSSNNKIEEKYQKEFEIYSKNWKAECARVEKENKRKAVLETELKKMQNQYAETGKALENLYNLNVLYPKYRDIVTVITFYEYFASGRCSQLEGHEGAYNIYENEIRMNIIISRLDEIIRNLEEIKRNQYLVYSTLKESNQKVNSLYEITMRNLQHSKEIAKQSEITAYHSQITARNTEILSYIAMRQAMNG